MRKALKIVGLCVGVLVLLAGIAIWRNVFFYAKIWGARITVDGRACGECALYVHRNGVGGVLVRRDGPTSALYSVVLPNPKSAVPNGAVWKCVDGAFTFVPGFAYDSLYQWCTPGGFAPSQKQLRMNSGLIEFTADDGKRVKAEW